MTSEALKAFRKRNKERQGGFERDHSVFPFWNVPFDGSATLRLIPWEDELTKEIWTEKKIIKMNFVDPNNEDKLIRFEAPCYEMYARDKKCPILQPVRDMYDEAKALKNAGDTQGCDRLEKIAGAHWIKPVFYYQGFVIKPGFAEEEVPENPIRVFPMLKQIHQVIFSKLMSEEEDGFDQFPCGEFSLEDVQQLIHGGEIPDDEMDRIITRLEGINFILKKTRQGKHANYQTSSWASHATALTEEQLLAIDKYGVHPLRERLPDQPSDEQYDLMTDMVNVSIGRLLGTDDGYWNPEWEEAGLKPKRMWGDSNNASEDKPAASRTSSANTANKLRSQLNRATKADEPQSDDSDDSNDAAVATVLEKAKRGRGAKVASETPDADSEAKTTPTKSALAARIRGGLKKQQAEA